MSTNKWSQSTDYMNNAVWKNTNVFKLKTAQSLIVGHCVWLHVERAAQECLSVLSVSSGGGIIMQSIWQGILRLFQRIEFSIFLGYLESIIIGKVCKCLFDRISNPLGKKALYVPRSPLEICLFQTPLPLRISVTLRGGGRGGVWIFSGTTQFVQCHALG